MNIKITGKEVKATEAIKDYVEKKLERIQKYFEEDFDVNVTIRTEKNMQIAEMHVITKANTYRAVTEHRDLYASIDKDIDILEGQIRKAKTKRDRINKEESIRVKENSLSLNEEKEITDEILKTIYYDIKPIAPEDAKLKLEEMKGNNFLTFINVDTGKVNVIFRLKDGKNYGLVEPEC
ncbi:MAG: ribosome-associated translation inhibitor RaiA [Clostridia bacterium]|jgi:putative sigma-54 modulation protein|nr:ribosome-associated translation inhibitor RaiA [Clostridia bacterium]